MKKKDVYIIAGTNGSGKTTFAEKFLPDYANCPHFVNADLIAHGLSPFSPGLAAMKAGRLVLEQIQELANKNCNFAFETTLAGKSYISLIKKLKKANYSVHLFFLWVTATELALARIKERVADGGHNVPASDVHRRFRRGIYNLFKSYRQLLDSWILFNNSKTTPAIIAEEKEGKLTITDNKLFNKILKDLGISL